MHPYLEPFHAALEQHADPERALTMSAYMKGHFPFIGVPAPLRRSVLREHIARHGKVPLNELPAVVRSAFALSDREMHHTGVDLMLAHAKHLTPGHLPLLEELITTNSWWDTVDALAVRCVGGVLHRNRAEALLWNDRWIGHADMWLVRTALLFQNRWRGDADRELLFSNILQHGGHRDFFIRKAIGWSLRELARTDPGSVQLFVRWNSLHPLSVREALKHIGT